LASNGNNWGVSHNNIEKAETLEVTPKHGASGQGKLIPGIQIYLSVPKEKSISVWKNFGKRTTGFLRSGFIAAMLSYRGAELEEGCDIHLPPLCRDVGKDWSM